MITLLCAGLEQWCQQLDQIFRACLENSICDPVRTGCLFWSLPSLETSDNSIYSRTPLRIYFAPSAVFYMLCPEVRNILRSKAEENE